MTEVKLNVYDIRSSSSEATSSTISVFNNVMHSVFGLGGVFHGAIEVYGEEWSFGYCDYDSGVYSCPPRANPCYTYRQSISLGMTRKSPTELAVILAKMKTEWHGKTYDLLTRNCCNFCEQFAEELGVKSVPVWLNRLATGVESALVFSDKVLTQFANVKESLQQSSQESVAWLSSSFEELKESFGSFTAIDSGAYSSVKK
eukprot:g853.t1